MAQLTHNESFFTKKTFPVTLVCDNISYQPNIGSLFRVCEAFGVEKIIFVAKNLALTPRKINKTSRSTHLMVPHEVMESAEDVITYLQQNEYQIVALEITSSSTPLKEVKLQPGKPVALIAGNEADGISPQLLNIAHKTAHIEMFGANSSMNVVQAVGIALYDLTGKMP